VTARCQVALVGRPSPERQPAGLVDRFRELLERGFDTHLLADGGDPGTWPGISDLSPGVASERVHPAPRAIRRGAPSALLVRALARGVARHPRAAARAAYRGGRGDRRRLADRYVDASLLALRPGLVHFASPFSALRRAALARAIGATVLVGLSETDLDRLARAHPDTLARVWASADIVVVASPSVRDRALELGCPEETPTTLDPEAPELDWLVADAAETPPAVAAGGDRPLRVLSVGPMTWRQGLEFALDAVRLLVDREVACEYRIAGDGGFEPAVGFARHQLGLERQVTILDPLGRDELREQLAWADVFLAPVVAAEHTAVAEAQAMGVPAVATARASSPDLTLSGIEVPPRDALAVADALASLAKDPGLRERLGRMAPERAREHAAAANGGDLMRIYAEAGGDQRCVGRHGEG
jgi:glycosyltransferase involved in cell wall biosynthesis